MKIDRLIGILSILLQQEKVTAPYLAETFEVSRRTINRDVEALCKAGIPIITTQGVNGGISIMEGYSINRMLLTSSDMQAILTGLRSLDSVCGTNRYGQLMEKLVAGAYGMSKNCGASLKSSASGSQSEASPGAAASKECAASPGLAVSRECAASPESASGEDGAVSQEGAVSPKVSHPAFQSGVKAEVIKAKPEAKLQARPQTKPKTKTKANPRANSRLKTASMVPGDPSILIDLASWYRDALTPKIEQIHQAIERGEWITFTYFSFKGESRRVIEPYYLVFQWSSWYVWGWCGEREDFRLFKLNRLEDLELTGKMFEKREAPLPDLSVERVFPENFQVKVLFEPRCKWRLIEEYGKSSFTVQPDGKLLFSWGFTDKENLFCWILTFERDAELLEPEEFRKELGQIGEELGRKYSGRKAISNDFTGRG